MFLDREAWEEMEGLDLLTRVVMRWVLDRINRWWLRIL